MFKLILRYTFTGLFASQFVMFCMLITKFAYEDMPFFLPLPVITFFAMDLMVKWYGRLENHVPLSLAVTQDMRFWRVSKEGGRVAPWGLALTRHGAHPRVSCTGPGQASSHAVRGDPGPEQGHLPPPCGQVAMV